MKQRFEKKWDSYLPQNLYHTPAPRPRRYLNDQEVPGIYQPMDVWSYTVCGDTAHPYPLGDIDKDCYVNYFDFAIIGDQWGLPPGVPSADIAPEVPDGVVNLHDLAVFAAHWLEYLDP